MSCICIIISFVSSLKQMISYFNMLCCRFLLLMLLLMSLIHSFPYDVCTVICVHFYMSHCRGVSRYCLRGVQIFLYRRDFFLEGGWIFSKTLGVVHKLRHAKNNILEPPPFHKTFKEIKNLEVNSPPLKRDVICERPPSKLKKFSEEEGV